MPPAWGDRNAAQARGVTGPVVRAVLGAEPLGKQVQKAPAGVAPFSSFSLATPYPDDKILKILHDTLIEGINWNRLSGRSFCLE